MILLPATILVLAFATFVVSVVRPPTTIAKLVGLYLLSYANVVLVAEVAATLRMLNPRVFLLLHLALATAAWILWNRAGRPPLMTQSVSIRSVLSRRSVLNSLRSHPGLWALGLGVGVAYLIGAGLVVTVPPNNYDSMTYHLSRVGYWLQHNSFYPWPTPYPPQTTYPMNAEIGIMWTVVFWGTDQLAGFVQWLAVWASMAAIGGLSRLVGASRAEALFAALLWATLPEIVLQSTTTQNDLVAAAFFASAVYLLYAGFRSQHRGMLLLSGLGLGLALGTKTTVLFLIPGLAATILMLCFVCGKQPIRQLLVWAGASLSGFLLLGAYVFALNLLVYGHALGPPSFVHDMAASRQSWATRFAASLPRSLYQTVDLTGLPDSIAEPLHQIKATVGTRVFSILDLPTDFTPAIGEPGESDLQWRPPVHEDFAGFGPLAFLLLMPAVTYGSLIALKKKDPFPLGLALMSASLFLFVCSLSWFPWDNRYLVPAAALCAPLIAPIYERKVPHPLLTWSVIGLALLVIGFTTTHNLSKPLVGARPIWKMDWIERQALNRTSMEPVLRAVDRLIPLNATIGTMLGTDDWDYPMFGRRFSRRIIPLYPAPESIDPDWLEAQSINFVLVVDPSGAYVSRAAADLHTLWNAGGWYLLYREESDFASWEPTVRNSLLGEARTSVLVIDEGLAGAVGVGGLTPPWWEEHPGEFIWLGQGDNQGVRAELWSDQELMVELAFDVAPGPGRPDALRTVDLTLENESGVQRERQRFDRTTTVSFVVQLQPGRNEFTFGCLDEATVLEQPNGDTRPLLVRIDAIRVTSLFNRGQAGPADSPLVTLDPALRGVVGILSHLETPPWDVEVYDDGSLLWLGQGDEQGIRAVLWSDRELMVELAFDVAPGPGRRDALRTVHLTLENDAGVQRQDQTLDTSTTLRFAMQLQPGRNDFTFGCLDEATVLEQANGDTRPLLVLLRQVRIEPLVSEVD